MRIERTIELWNITSFEEPTTFVITLGSPTRDNPAMTIEQAKSRPSKVEITFCDELEPLPRFGKKYRLLLEEIP